MTRTSTTLRKYPRYNREHPDRVRLKAESKFLRRPSYNRIWSSVYSSQRRPIYRTRLDGRNPKIRRSRNTRKPRKSHSSPYRELDAHHDSEDDIDELTDSETERKDEDFFWNEEQTLLSNLMEEATVQGNSDEDWLDLVDSLQDAFEKDSVELKRETAHAFVTTVNKIRGCYSLFDEQDKAYGKGILILNKRLKEYEFMSVATEDTLKEAYGAAQSKIDELLKQLEESYSRRDKLWVDLHEEIDRIVNPVADLFEATPSKIERVIAGIDGKSSIIEKEEGNSRVYAEEMLREFLKTL